MGLFHCGVEVHFREYSFVFVANSDATGVRRYSPKNFAPCKFCESICVGHTDRSLEETKDIVRSLTCDWSAATYHIGRRNCLHFTEALVDALGLHEQFPLWLKSATETAMNSPAIGPIIDGFWLCASWYLARNGSVLDCRPSKCCKCSSLDNNGTMCRVYQESLLHDQSVRCCFQNSEQVEPAASTSEDSTIDNEEVVFETSDHASSFERKVAWARTSRFSTVQYMISH